MITIRGLHKRYGSREVLRGVEASVEPGSIVGVIGASGCGKTTLLRCLNALEAFDEGTIEIAGHALYPARATANLNRLRADVGMVFQDYQLFPHLDVLDNVTLAPRVVQGLPRGEARDLARHWLERVGLGERAASWPAELSGGQKQRVALARALAQGARVLLLDEPTSALDPEMRNEVRGVLTALVHEAERALTLVVVTHDLALVGELASELWLLDDGRVIERGPARELLSAHESRVGRDYLSHLSPS